MVRHMTRRHMTRPPGIRSGYSDLVDVGAIVAVALLGLAVTSLLLYAVTT